MAGAAVQHDLVTGGAREAGVKNLYGQESNPPTTVSV
ncbi:hypothetical protein G9444_0049 [Rhodococcus erythropolis]|uniref:Uncharacterized protein n=1 Tax=Rhodococcus erythropolis TaxID=1833 RepID=A0A6G9CJV0_RHOER|nr:hypothetical protein G9444_0049 [Rhodococcus erythropolis]